MDVRQKFWIDRFAERERFKDMEKQPDSMIITVCTLYANNCLSVFDEKFTNEKK